MLKQIFTRKKLSGFSLLEIMAVVAIVAIALVGTTKLVVQSLRAQQVNRSTIIAYQLAQEGVELVRYIRDTNWLQARDWDEGMELGEYCLDYLSPELILAADLNDCQLYLNNDNHYYHPRNSPELDEETIFKRKIEILSLPYSAPSLGVRVSISWFEGGMDNNYILETELFDWK